MITYITLFFLIHTLAPLLSLSIDSTPICSVYTPNSILDHKEKYRPLFIGTKERYATCTGATWFHENYLAVINLYGRKIDTYKFYPQKNRFEFLQEINNTQGAQLTNSENLVVSPDGSLLALCSGDPHAGIKIYRINMKTHFINPKPILNLNSDSLVHNIRFTPDGKYLATTSWNNNEAVCIYKFFKNSRRVILKRQSQLKNTNLDLVTKGINFTQDGKFAVIAQSAKASSNQKDPIKGLISVYTFDPVHGSFGDLVCSIDTGYKEFCYEDIAFIDNDRTIIFADQNNNALTSYSFNSTTGQISPDYLCVHGKETQLDFPHGIGVKKDGKYLVVTNYGDDKFSLYRIQ